jgi:putative peptidoglycan lipid II flippase
VIVAAIYRTGQFKQADVIYVWGILAGATVGLLAQTLGRLYSSTYYALRDTRTPLKFAIVRVVLTTILGYLCAIPLPPAIGISPRWGVAGLTISAGVSSWVEFTLLRRTLNQRIGRTGLAAGYVTKLWLAAIAASAIGWLIHQHAGRHSAIFVAIIVLGPYGIAYFGATWALGVREALGFFGRLLIPLRGSKPG